MNLSSHIHSSAEALTLTHCQGQVIEKTWNWPDSIQPTDLTQVLQTMGLTPLHTGFPLNGCQLSVRTDAAGKRLVFFNYATSLACNLNGQPLPALQHVLLNDQDILEVGLCRFVVGAQSATAAADLHPVAHDPIELTTLAPPSKVEAPWVAQPKPLDAIDDLLSKGAWTEHATQAPQRPHARTPQHAPQTTRSPHAAPAKSEAATQTTASSSDREDSLKNWHALYLRRLQSPHATDDEGDWQREKTQQLDGPQDPFEDLKNQAEGGRELTELLGQGVHISHVLAQLDRSHNDVSGDVLALGDPENVLHLFAPEGWAPPSLTTEVPQLTRQEHHGTSIDSAVFLPTAQPTPPKPKL